MSVLVQTPDGWEQVEDAAYIRHGNGGALMLVAATSAPNRDGEIVCSYAAGAWLYAEVEP